MTKLTKIGAGLALVALVWFLAPTVRAQEISATASSETPTTASTVLSAESPAPTTGLTTDDSTPVASNPGDSQSTGSTSGSAGAPINPGLTTSDNVPPTTCDTNPCTTPVAPTTPEEGNGGGSSGGRRPGGTGGNADQGVDLTKILNELVRALRPAPALADGGIGADPRFSSEVSDVAPVMAMATTSDATSSDTNSDQLAAAGALGSLSGWAWFWIVLALALIIGVSLYVSRRSTQN